MKNKIDLVGQTENTDTPTLTVIDLGTNTFHLLIVRGTDEHGVCNEVYRERHSIKLVTDHERITEKLVIE